MSVGVGTLAGSTIMLLTIAWGGSLLAGRCDLNERVRGLSPRPSQRSAPQPCLTTLSCVPVITPHVTAQPVLCTPRVLVSTVLHHLQLSQMQRPMHLKLCRVYNEETTCWCKQGRSLFRTSGPCQQCAPALLCMPAGHLRLSAEPPDRRRRAMPSTRN